MSDLKLIRKGAERLGDQLYGQILEQIVSGAIKEGEKLPSENHICRLFQVSRPTVREALLRLHADGLVTTRQGSGTVVQKRPSGDLVRLSKASDIAGMLRCIEVRIALEGRAASLAALRYTPAQLERIMRALEAMRTSFLDGSVPTQADFDFHCAVAGASGNTLFVEMLQMLNETIHHSMTVALGLTHIGSSERARRVFEEHEAISDAIARRDPEASDLAMRYHLHRARQRMTDGQKDL